MIGRDFVSWLVVLCALAVTGCSGPSRSPEQVAEAFWLSVLTDDLDGVRAQSTASSAAELDLSMLEMDATVTFGDTTVDEQTASVATHLQDPAGTDPVAAIDTVLLLEDGEWRVDATDTLASARREMVTGVAKDIRELGKEIQRELEAAVEELRNEMPKLRDDLEALGELTEQLRRSLDEQVPVIQKEVDDLLLALQEILQADGPPLPEEES